MKLLRKVLIRVLCWRVKPEVLLFILADLTLAAQRQTPVRRASEQLQRAGSFFMLLFYISVMFDASIVSPL